MAVGEFVPGHRMMTMVGIDLAVTPSGWLASLAGHKLPYGSGRMARMVGHALMIELE